MAHDARLELPAGTVLGMVLAFVIGSVVSLPALKLTVEYLILLTLAVSVRSSSACSSTFPQLGGTYGLIGSADRRPVRLGRCSNPRDWVIPSFVGMVHRVLHLPAHRRVAVRPGAEGHPRGPVATQALGKNVFGYKVVVFGITSALAGFAGLDARGLAAAGHARRVRLLVLAHVFAIVIFGGMGNLDGTILGAAVVVLLEPVLRRVDQDGGRAGPASCSSSSTASSLVVLMRVRPAGRAARGLLAVALDPRRARGDRTRRDGRGLGAAEQHRGPRARAGRRSRPPTSPSDAASGRGTTPPVVLETHGRQQALRRHRRRRATSTSSCARAPSPPSSAPTAPARPRCSTCSPGSSRPTRGIGQAERRRAGRPEPRPGGPPGSGPLVPGRAAVQPARRACRT